MNQKRTIVHIVNKSKFAFAYINYMKMEMLEWNHIFVTEKQDSDIELIDYEQVYYVQNYKSLKDRKHILELVRAADVIVVSGLFASKGIVYLFSGKMLEKTYIHFWGGDFYGYQRQEGKHLRNIYIYASHAFSNRIFQKCRGLIFLIDGEYQKFVQLIGIENKHYIAPMPYDPHHRIDYSAYCKSNKDGIHRILLGNSATSSNQHLEVLQWLNRFVATIDMEVICPLSYGDKKYREEIIDAGTRLLGEKFKPILNYMNEEQYVELLSTCEIGIFNHNRQQAMGNIDIMLSMGKKVFLRTDTSMWNVYQKRGFIIYPAEQIEVLDQDVFFEIDKNVMKKNCEAGVQYQNNYNENAKRLWEKVFDA